MPTLLIVDDEPSIVELACLYLSNDGLAVLSANDGQTALQLIAERQPDLIVLDIMLPALDGWEVCRRLRQSGNRVPIIFLTARSEEVDKIVGLELGADDYMTKPFNPRELVARVKAVLRRMESTSDLSGIWRVGRLEINPQQRRVSVEGREIKLRQKEFDLLVALAEHPGFVLSREQLLERVWGYDFPGGTRTVDVHIARLRSKLANTRVSLEAVWNIGYKLLQE